MASCSTDVIELSHSDMATHIKQLRELFMKDYPDILAEFEEEWRPQRPADCFTSTLDAFVYDLRSLV